ncbi:MAG: VOC family protein, partial [Nitrososphaeraceae archaeon]|nr:VOC family protein [Nitrososphaeraceae archaeon]
MSYKIKGISLLVTDVKKSLEFYNGILGMQISQETEDRIEFAYKGGENISITLGKTTPENESKSVSSNGNIMITFMITNFDELHNVLITNDIKFYRKVNEG